MEQHNNIYTNRKNAVPPLWQSRLPWILTLTTRSPALTDLPFVPLHMVDSDTLLCPGLAEDRSQGHGQTLPEG